MIYINWDCWGAATQCLIMNKTPVGLIPNRRNELFSLPCSDNKNVALNTTTQNFNMKGKVGNKVT